MKSSQLRYVPHFFIITSLIGITIAVTLLFTDLLSKSAYTTILLCIFVINITAKAIWNRAYETLERNELYAKLK